MPGRTSFLSFSRWDLVLFWLYLALLTVLFGTAINNVDPDLWHRFVVADYLFHTGHFAPGTTFAYLGIPETRPDIEWGGAVILYLTWLLGGGTGIVILKLVTLGVTLVLIVRAGLGNRTPTMLDAFFYSLVILALASSFYSTLRSEAATHVLFALWVLWFQQERRGDKIPFWLYPLTMVLWVNLHGGFLLGLVWQGVIGGMEFLSGGNWRRRALIIGLCLLATLINPFGYAMWLSAFEALSIPRTNFQEWAPVPWLHDVGLFCGYKLLVLWMLAVVGVHLYRSGRKADWTSVVLLLLFLIPAQTHARHTSIYAIIAGGLLPPLFLPEKSLHDIREWKPWLHRLVIRSLLVALPLVYAWRLWPTNEGLRLTYPPDTCPIGAVAYLREAGVTGNLLVDYNGGSYATWELRDRMRVSMNSRYEAVFTYATFDEVQRFFDGGEHWQDALHTNPSPNAILVAKPAGVYEKLLIDPYWTQVYVDETHAVFRPK